MAIKAQSQITLSCVVDVAATYRYYLLQASTLSPPDKPTKKPPGGSWSDTEPSYTSGSTNTLYFVDLTVFSDGTWAYSSVSKSSAYEAAKEAYNKAQKVTETVDGLTKIQDGDVLIDGDKVYLSAAFVKSIFAQNIEATGTIKGGTLKGTEIIGAALHGGAINIEGSFEGYAGTEKGYLKTESNGSGTPHLILGMGSASITLEPNGMNDVVIDGADIYVGAPGKASSTSVYDLYVNHSITADCDFNEYEISVSGVITSGTIRVVKKLGWCLVHGGITLSATASDWITILNAARVPGTQHGEAIFKTIPYWGASYGRPLRVSVMADGGLRIRYGSKGEFQFDFCYPIY